MKQNKNTLEEAIINSHDNRIKSLEVSVSGILFWMIIFGVLIIGLFVLSTIIYYTLPHRICHDETTTTKVEIESIDPYHNNNLGVIREHQYPNAKITCESGVEESHFDEGVYIGEVGKTCLVTTTKQICEIK